MSAKLRVSFKLSPNEEAAVLRSQREERRKARIIQVREQEKEAARSAREAEKRKRERETSLIQDHIQTHLLASHAAELAAVQDRYSSAAKQIGLGHRQAQQVEKEENRLYELRLLLMAKQRERANDRHVAALREELSHRELRKGERRRQVERLRLTREQEGQRARSATTRAVSSYPQPIIMDLVAGKGRRVRLHEVEGYSSSYYHIPSCTVQRAATEERDGPDAQQMAELMSEEMQAVDRQCVAVEEEQKELARLRHMHALNKVKLKREEKELLQQLKTLEREDRTLRQKALATMPSNMYQPVERRKEAAREQQRDMEQAFERLFVETHGASTHRKLFEIANSATDPITPPTIPPSTSSNNSSKQAASSAESGTSLLERSTIVAGGEVTSPEVRRHVRVSIPTAKCANADHSQSSSMAMTPSSSSRSFLASTVSNISTAEDTATERTGVGVEEWMNDPKRKPMAGKEPVARDSDSAVDSNPHQHQQHAAPGELSLSDLTPSEVQYQEPAAPVISLQPSGVKRLVSMVHAQQQAWSQRVATRNTLSTSHPLSSEPHSEEGTATPAAHAHPSLLHLSSHSLSPSPEPVAPVETPSLSLHTKPNRQQAWFQQSTHTLHHHQPTTHHHSSLNPMMHAFSHHLTGTTGLPPEHKSPTPDLSSVHSPLGRAKAVSITMNTSDVAGGQCIQQRQDDSTLSYPLPHSPSHTASSSHPAGTEHIALDPQSLAPVYSTLSHLNGEMQIPLGGLAGGEHEGERGGGDKDLSLSSESTKPSDYACYTPDGGDQFPTMVQPSHHSNSLGDVTVTSSVEGAIGTASVSLSSSTTAIPSLLLHPPTVSTAAPTALAYSLALSQPTPSQLTNSMLTPSTVSGFSLTPVSFLADLSPLITTTGHTEPSVAQGRDGEETQAHVPGAKSLERMQSVSAALDVPRPNVCESGQTMTTPTLLSRPDLSIATEDTDPKLPGHRNASKSLIMAWPEVSTDTVASLDTTPTHATLHLPADFDTKSDSSASRANTHTSNSVISFNSRPLSLGPDSPLPPSSLHTVDTTLTTDLPTTTSSASTATATTSASLQEVFLRRKMDFIQQSQRRLEQIGTNATERRIQSSLRSDSVVQNQQQRAVMKTDKQTPDKQHSSLPNQPRPESVRGGGKENRKRTVTFSSPVRSPGMSSPSSEHKVGTQGKKISSMEMKQRNARFYNRLPEVRRKRLEEKRLATYESNRQNAKAYQQKLRAKVQKKPLKMPVTVRKPPFK